MTTDRAYRAAMSRQDACRELRAAAGTQFDPEVVSAVIAELERRDAGPPSSPADAPVQLVAERVRVLLERRAG
jgi:HD-GYP domain-containing protein (c-di-GMP phosphodiesterase class II)